MSIWGFLGSNTQKQSLWNIDFGLLRFWSHIFKAKWQDVGKFEVLMSNFEKVFFENLEITFWESLKNILTLISAESEGKEWFDMYFLIQIMPQIPHNKFQVTCPSAAHLTSIILLQQKFLKKVVSMLFFIRNNTYNKFCYILLK